MFLSQVIGNLGSDVALMDGENGKKYATFSVAHTEYTKDAGGNPVEHPVWISISWYNYTDKQLACLKKGTKVFISGRTKVRLYTDKTGHPQINISVYAAEVALCGVKNGNTVEEQ